MPQSKRRGRGRRRTSAKGSDRVGLRIPWVPVVAVVGVIAVVAVVAYLVLQSGSSSSANEEWVEVEGDPAPELPGEFVDIQEIYGGTYGTHGENVTAQHVTRQVDYAADGNTNPPAGGPHWGASACGDDPTNAPAFCGPAPWGVYRESWDAETVVHNMEHGGVVIWYNCAAGPEPLDETACRELRDGLAGITEMKNSEGKQVLMLPYPGMDHRIALTAWATLDTLEELDMERVALFVDAYDRLFNPEGF